MGNLAGKTLFITGASRGIGKAIAMRAAADGANIVVVAKTIEPHPKLPGTIYSAVEEIQAAGGQALAVQTDIRFEDQVEQAVQQATETFGGIDIVINNASAIFLAGTAETPIKRFDLMHTVNTRGTFLVTQKCLPALLAADNPHVLNISPPLSFEARWFAPHVAYTMAKFAVQGNAADKIYDAVGSDAKSMSGAGNIGVSLLSGVIAGVVAAIISHPADTLLSKINSAGAGGTGSMMSRLGNIASEVGFVNLCTVGLGPRCIMIGTLTAGQFGVFDIVMGMVGAKKFHFHDPAH